MRHVVKAWYDWRKGIYYEISKVGHLYLVYRNNEKYIMLSNLKKEKGRWVKQ